MLFGDCSFPGAFLGYFSVLLPASEPCACPIEGCLESARVSSHEFIAREFNRCSADDGNERPKEPQVLFLS
jgi:hypothetical protein